MFKILFYKIARSLSIGENGQKMVYKMFISTINNLGLILGRSKIVQTMFNHCKHVLLESSMGDYLVFGFHRRFPFVIKTDIKITECNNILTDVNGHNCAVEFDKCMD